LWCVLSKYYSGDKIKKDEMGSACDTYRVLVGKSEGKRPLGRPEHRTEGYSTKVLKETGWEDVD
jgi:hypothetical protein